MEDIRTYRDDEYYQAREEERRLARLDLDRDEEEDVPFHIPRD